MVADARLQTPYAVHLALPNTMQIHPVFHVSLLEHAANDPFPGQWAEPPGPVMVDGEEEQYVDGILDSQEYGRCRKLQYLNKWSGEDHATWEAAVNVNSLQAIDRFHALYPGKPGPLPEPPR